MSVILRLFFELAIDQMSERIIAIIPARLGSVRFPGKPLAPLLGRPMIEHVFWRTSMCGEVAEVYVATCDEEIKEAVAQFGGSVIMTSPAHERASDRVAEAAERIPADIIVMVQGDEPMVTPEMISAAVAPMLIDRSIECVNLAHRITNRNEYLDPNTIKVVMNAANEALYFSRAPIPAIDNAHLARTRLEQAESIDMLRVIEHGRRVRMVQVEIETHAVDTLVDLRFVEASMKYDPLTLKYGERVARAEAR